MVTSADWLDELPDSLRERARLLRSREPVPGEFVLYWMRTAVRSEENPALDAAIHLANCLDLPVFVYHALSERYPYASDRHHTFVLQGARDVQQRLQQREIAYAFHLERPGHRGPHLRELGRRAAVVVTEEMPTPPLNRWTELLSRQLDRPVVTVDTACVVPMQRVGKAYDRAFAYRKATEALYAEKVSQAAAEVEPIRPARLPGDLPFRPLDLRSTDLAGLVAGCEIDHAVGPVPSTVGGSSAGYRRWDRFCRTGLRQYHQRRNSPLVDGVSRLSPYLHYGMVAPQRIAREAADVGGKGAEKFLDELLIWRELAYAFCFYRPAHTRLSVLPSWAQATLHEHADDRRPDLFDWETLARGRTQDAFWDAAQRSLLIHGELHNNVRMTWGKAIPQWTAGPQQALRMLIDLNHRYALDGRDPASYGGLLWCLGQFDRPFRPPQEILGTVRGRATEQHAKRLHPQSFLRKVTRPLYHPTPSVAVVGAGLAGTMAARTLADHGVEVTVFEKSQGFGGRMATRQVDDQLAFDHGTQYFIARDPRFQRYLKAWLAQGLAQPWQGRIVSLVDGAIDAEKSGRQRYVAVPEMPAICSHLAADLQVRRGVHVTEVGRDAGGWQLTASQGTVLGSFDWIVLSAPAAQTAQLLAAEKPAWKERAHSTAMSGCWALMLGFDEPLPLAFDGAFPQASSLSWIARNSSKPGRPRTPETWVLHGSPEWTQAHLEATPEAVQRELLDEFSRVTGAVPPQPIYQVAHLWRHALPTQPLDERCLFDPALQCVACGDWCGGPRVEGAFLSGMAAAGRIMGALNSSTVAAPPQAEIQLRLFDAPP